MSILTVVNPLTFIKLSFLCLSILLMGRTGWAQSNLIWENPLPHGHNLSAVTYGNGIYVAVGEAGAVTFSTNGLNWNFLYTSNKLPIYAICHGQNTFVAVGTNGLIMTSTNGTDWFSQLSSTTNALHAVTFGNGRFIAGGRNGVLLSSPDGTNWTVQSSGTTSVINGLAYGNERFLAVTSHRGPQGTNNGLVVSSPDGLSWTTNSAPLGDHLSITFGNGYFVVHGYKLAPLLASAPATYRTIDGINWLSGNNTFGNMYGLAYGGGTFVSANGNGIYRSVNASNWTVQASFTNYPTAYAVTFGSNGFVAVGNFGAILNSSDGLQWVSAVRYSPPAQCSGFASDGSTIITAASGVLYYSTNAPFFSSSTFSNAAAVTPPSRAVAFGLGKFVGVGGGGTVASSTNGIDWTSRSSGTANTLNSVAFGQTNFVAVGNGGTIISSATGNAWTGRFSGTTVDLVDITYGGGKWVAVGYSGTILTSSDLINWEGQDSGTGNPLLGVAYGNGVFIVTSSLSPNDYAFLRSTNGASWQRQQSISNFCSSVAYGNGMFVGVGASGTVYVSFDGAVWAEYLLGFGQTLASVSYVDSHFKIAGANGAIFRWNGFPLATLSQPRLGANGFNFIFNGQTGSGYTLQRSADLTNWLDLFSFSNSVGTMPLLDSNPPTASKFYRVTKP